MQATVVPVRHLGSELSPHSCCFGNGNIFRCISARPTFLKKKKCSPFFCVSFVSHSYVKPGQARILSADHPHPQFPKLVFACFAFGLFKEFLTVSLLSRSAAYTCDLHIEGCASRLVLLFFFFISNDETRRIYAYVSSSCGMYIHFVSYSTTSYPDIITRRFNPSPPLFLPTVSSGDVTYAAPPLCTYSTGNTENRRQCLSWFFGERGKAKGALKLSHRHSRGKGKYGLLSGMRANRQRVQE